MEGLELNGDFLKLRTIFYNKELSDIIRDIVLNSACDFDNALILIKLSNNLNRDVELIKKLVNSGVSVKKITFFIRVINS